MPAEEIQFRQIVTADIDRAKAREMAQYEKAHFKFATSLSMIKRFDMNMFSVWQRKRLGPMFIRERFWCSNTLILKYITRRKDKKALLKRFNGMK